MSLEQPATHMGQDAWTSEPCLYSRTSILIIQATKKEFRNTTQPSVQKKQSLPRIETGKGHQGQQK